MTKIEKAFLTLLRKKGLLAKKADVALTTGGVEGEDMLLAKWEKASKSFVYKGERVEVRMNVSREYAGESFCYPVINIKKRE